MILTLKIALKGVTKPPVWRRIRINADATFGDLHHAIQCAFGWYGFHLHEFIEIARGNLRLQSREESRFAQSCAIRCLLEV